MTERPIRKPRCLFIVWKGYQRRVEVLAPLFDADVMCIPHLFRHKRLRPLDYLYKLFVSVFYILRTRPDYALVQSPPHYAALPAILTRLPYIVDGHNGIFQSYWHRLPLFSAVLKSSKALVVHNHEFARLYQADYPDYRFFVIPDPLQEIRVDNASREANKILFVCSFDPDEPVDVITETIEQLPEYNFVITADLIKLSPAQRQRLKACPNLHLTGFLSTEEYQRTLCTSTAAVALTNMEATQQSGACEALSSDTPLIATRSALSEQLFGQWASLVENNAEAVVDAIRHLEKSPLDLAAHRTAWNERVHAGVDRVLEEVLGHSQQLPGVVHGAGGRGR